MPRLSGPAGQVWAGDDAAVVPGPSGALLFCSDAVVAGVHADLSLVGLDDFGWKALAATVSDIAAMGGRALAAVVTVCGPLGSADFDVSLLYDGVLAAAAAFSCPVVGGDLSQAAAVMVSVAVAGDGGGGGGGSGPVLRSGARAGDAIFVTGPLGASAAGLELLRMGQGAVAPALVESHRRPVARLEEGAAARAAGATAMIDVSDGLAVDLRRVAEASGVGVVVDEVPVASGVDLAGGDPELLALGGGEDYELVFTAPDAAALLAEFAGRGLRVPIHIGRCTDTPSEYRLRGGPLPEVGWEHQG